MFEGDLIEGELEIGQIAGLIQEVKSAEGIILEMIADYNAARQEIVAIDF
jgi:enoyl-[acyl-carrier protein] reductase II